MWVRWAGRNDVAPSWSSGRPGRPVPTEAGSSCVPSSIRCISSGSGSEVSTRAPCPRPAAYAGARGGPSGPLAARMASGMPSMRAEDAGGASPACGAPGRSGSRRASARPGRRRRRRPRGAGWCRGCRGRRLRRGSARVPGRRGARARRRGTASSTPRGEVDEGQPGGSPSNAFSAIASTRSATLAPDGAVMASASQISWTTCSSAGSVSSTQWAPLPTSTPAPLAYRASTINVGSLVRAHGPSSPITPVLRTRSDLSETCPNLATYIRSCLGECGGRLIRGAKGDWRGT